MSVVTSVHNYRDRVLSADGPINPATRLVCLAISKFVNGRTLSTFVSQARLAEATGLADRSVRTHVAMAAEAGWLKRSHRNRGKNWKLTTYTLALPHRAPVTNAEANSSGASKRANDAPANGALAPANPADGPAISALGPAKNGAGDRQGFPPIQEEDPDKEPVSGSSARASSLVTDPLARAGPQEPMAERMRKARITLQSIPDFGREKLRQMFRLSNEQAAAVEADVAGSRR